MDKLKPWRLFKECRRGFHSVGSTVRNNKLQPESKLELRNAVRAAERVVGYPTSFLNLRWLLSDEVANVASHLRKLIGTGHPLLKTVKDFFLDNDKPGWGLVVLLISRAGCSGRHIIDVERDKTADILHSQRLLAEVTEMIRSSIVIHRVIMQVKQNTDDAEILLYGNKIALMSGDYLLSRSYKDLAELRNSIVNELISSGLRDISEYEFLGRKDDDDNPFPEPPTHINRISKIQDENDVDFGPYDAKTCFGNPKEEWLLRSMLLGASLLGKSCCSALVLADAEKELQNQAYLFGKHLALAWQAKYDYEDFIGERYLNLVGAPVLMALCEDPEFYGEIIGNRDAGRIRRRVRELNGLERTKEIQELYAERAIKNLGCFQESDAINALKRIVGVM